MWGGSIHGVRNFSNVTIGGNSILVPTILGLSNSSIDYVPFDYFTTDPDGLGGLDDLDGDGFFDDLGPGESVTVGFDMEITPKDKTCGSSASVQYIQWEHIAADASWHNQCKTQMQPLRDELNYVNFIRN